jgi:Raf kinase inhibitor-like YbhB/YbcL family protein
MSRHRLTGLVLAAAVAATSGSALSADKKPVFDLRSPGVKEFSSLAKKNAGNTPPNCSGGNVSPALAWSGAPAATKSFAIVLFDADGNVPMGFVHWLGYGIPASRTSLKAGEASAPPPSIVGGKSGLGKDTYSGPCPPPGKAHPYIFIMMATDLAPDALAPGLTRDELAAALKGHILDRTTLVLRYGS